MLSSKTFTHKAKKQTSCEVHSTCRPYVLILFTIKENNTLSRERLQKVLVSSAAGHENVIGSSAPSKPPAEKSQGRAFFVLFFVP